MPSHIHQTYNFVQYVSCVDIRIIGECFHYLPSNVIFPWKRTQQMLHRSTHHSPVMANQRYRKLPFLFSFRFRFFWMSIHYSAGERRGLSAKTKISIYKVGQRSLSLPPLFIVTDKTSLCICVLVINEPGSLVLDRCGVCMMCIC